MSSWFHAYAAVNLFLTHAYFNCRQEYRLRTLFCLPHIKTCPEKQFLKWGFPFVEITLYVFFFTRKIIFGKLVFWCEGLFFIRRKKNTRKISLYLDTTCICSNIFICLYLDTLLSPQIWMLHRLWELDNSSAQELFCFWNF